MPPADHPKHLDVVMLRRTKVGLLSLAGIMIAAGAWFVVRNLPAPNTGTTQSLVDATGNQIFTDLFSLSYRPDEGRGNVAMAAVYYFPALHTALDKFTQTSEHQREVLTTLKSAGANTRSLAFYIMVDSVIPQTGFDYTKATLNDETGQVYPFSETKKMTTDLPQAPAQVRTASILFFDSTSQDGKTFTFTDGHTLTLKIPGIDGQDRQFLWSTRILPIQ